MKQRVSRIFRNSAPAFPLTLIFIFVTHWVMAQNDASTQTISAVLAQLRKTYEAEAATLMQQARATDTQWIKQYGEAVTRFAREAQSRGDFETWQAGRKELARFEKAHTIVAGDYVRSPDTLRALQQRAVEGRIEVRRKAARDTIALTDRLVARLENLKKELTIKGDAPGAQAASEEITRIRAHDIYSDALFSLDSKEPFENTPELALQQDSASPSDDVTGTTARVSPARLPSTPGIRISAPDDPPVPVAGTRLFMLTQTDICPPGSSPLSVSSRYLLREDFPVRQNGQNHVVDLVEVQLGIKAHADVKRVDDMSILIQYFSGRTSGEPFPVQYSTVQLASVDTRTLYLQIPPVSHQIQIVPSALGGTRPYVDRTLQFRGVAITVFDKSGKIIYQSVSDNRVSSLAGDADRYNEDGTLNFP